MSDGFTKERPELANGASNDAAKTAKCYSFQELQAACEANGWSISFRQLQPGQLKVSDESVEFAGILLRDHSVSLRIEVEAVAPESYLTVLAPVGNGEFRINGRSFDGSGLCLLESETELHSVNNSILRVMGMSVSNSLLQETGRATFESWESRSGDQMMLIEPGTAYVRRLRALMHSSISQPLNVLFAAERASAIAGDLAAIIAQGTETSVRTFRTSSAESWRIIRRARSYIEAHLCESIRMSSVCAYSATSLSKLERTFRRELQMSPSQYILARRLAAVNRELLDFRSGTGKISDVAMKFGFSHLGRFSGAYRYQFGELPSQTLQLG